MVAAIAGFAHGMDITLGWDGNTETNLAGYKVYYGQSQGGPYNGSGSSDGASPIIVQLAGLSNPNSPEITVRNLPDGVYYFVVTAFNTEGLESGYSNEVYAESPTAGPPPPENAAPLLSSLEVNSQGGSTAVYTNSRTVEVRMVASDDALVSEYLILDGKSDPNGEIFHTIPGGPRQNAIFTVSDFLLKNEDGSRTIYGWVKDEQGVLSAAASKTNVVLDRVAPTVAISYSKSGAFKAGESVTVTADFTDGSPVSGTPRISIDYAGSGNDLSNAAMTQVTNKRWTYGATIPSGNDGGAAVTVAAADAAGNPVGAHSGNTFVVDNAGPRVVDFPVIDFEASSLTITFSENDMKDAHRASNYSLDNGLLIAGNGVDISGVNRALRFPLNPGTLQRYVIYTLTIGSGVKDAADNAVSPNRVRVNDDDNDGMADDWEILWFGSITAKNGTQDSDGDGLTDREEYDYVRSNPGWGPARWALSPLNPDSDGDGIPDSYEALHGLNPVDSSDRDLDLDQDGWTNYEEYLYGTAANDPDSRPQAREAVEVIEIIPAENTGMGPDEKGVQGNTGFSVRMESVQGIDLTDPNAVRFTFTEGGNTYTRRLNDLNGANKKIVQAVPLYEDGNIAYALWAVYYRTNETAISKTYPAGAVIEVKVEAKDRTGQAMAPVTTRFRIQSEAEKNAEDAALPKASTTVDNTTMMKTVTVLSGPMQGASIIFPAALVEEIGVEPYFGPAEDIPPLREVKAVGAPLNLLPDMVFPIPVTLLIPCPGYDDPSGLEIYYFDGRDWWPACDSNGNVAPEGEGWMVPGSRVNHKQTSTGPAYIEIQVNHFSAAAATASSPPASVSAEGGSGGCFISSLWN